MLGRPLFRRLIPVALVLALSACGFHLRQSLVLPPDLGAVRVVSVDRYSPLAEALTQSLVRAGVPKATADMQDVTVLDLLTERWGDRPIALDELGRAQEFSLRYAVTFELRRADGSTPVPRQTIELAREYISNPVNSTGTEGEREILQRELRREMAASVLRRLDAVARGGGIVGGSPGPGQVPVAADAAKAALEAADAMDVPPAAEPPSTQIQTTETPPPAPVPVPGQPTPAEKKPR
jgi:LPS-assembly lipoprotein